MNTPTHLSAADVNRLDYILDSMAGGHLVDAHIEASLGASDAIDGVIRERFDRLAKALWEAHHWCYAWAEITRLRRGCV